MALFANWTLRKHRIMLIEILYYVSCVKWDLVINGLDGLCGVYNNEFFGFLLVGLHLISCLFFGFEIGRPLLPYLFMIVRETPFGSIFHNK